MFLPLTGGNTDAATPPDSTATPRFNTNAAPSSNRGATRLSPCRARPTPLVRNATSYAEQLARSLLGSPNHPTPPLTRTGHRQALASR